MEVLSAIADTQETALDLEARWVAQRILDFAGSLPLASGPAGFGDIAVLVRNSEVLAAFTRAFEQAGIPYLLNQGKGFFETREVVDLTRLLRAIDNPRDEISLAAVLRSPVRPRVRRSVAAAENRRQPRQCAAPARSPGSRRSARMISASCAASASNCSAGASPAMSRDSTALLMRAIDETGYGASPGSRALANIEKFLALAREASSRLTLAEFVDELDVATPG